MWDLVVSVPDHCLSFYLTGLKLINSSSQSLERIGIIQASVTRKS